MRSSAPDSTSHELACTPSVIIRRCPSGENSKECLSIFCPKERKNRPVSTLQIPIVLSAVPEATFLPSLESFNGDAVPSLRVFSVKVRDKRPLLRSKISKTELNNIQQARPRRRSG